MSSNIVLTGAGGMLGSAFKTRLASENLLCLSRTDLQVASWDALRARLLAFQPDLVIHTAANTDVEGSEDQPEQIDIVNVQLPQLLAQVCAASSARLVHFSSTGCYGNYKTTPYSDDDPLRPTTVHHRSKAASEEAVRTAHPSSLILRLGWLFGGDKSQAKNFVWARMLEAHRKTEMYSDPYQFGNPTWVQDVVTQVLALLQTRLEGTFNCVASGCVSRFDYVARILSYAGLPTRLLPKHFERKAPVSPNEAACNDKLDSLNLNLMPQWDDALRQYITSLI